MKRLDEIRNRNGGLIEAQIAKPEDPPVNLLLKRRAIRLFGGNERVALYRNDRFNIEITIPYKKGDYDGKRVPVAVKEEVEQLEESPIFMLHRIARTKTAGDVTFKTGKKHRVDPHTAHRIVDLHARMNIGNKEKLQDILNKGSVGLTKIAKFAMDHVKIVDPENVKALKIAKSTKAKKKAKKKR